MSDHDWLLRAVSDAAMARAKAAILATPEAFKVYGLKASQIGALRRKFCKDHGLDFEALAAMTPEQIEQAVRR